MLVNLRREWPINNLIGDCYVEVQVALDTWNRLIPHMHAATTGRNMNLLLRFTAWAFQRVINNVPHIRRHWLSMRKKLYSVAVPRKIKAPRQGVYGLQRGACSILPCSVLPLQSSALRWNVSTKNQARQSKSSPWRRIASRMGRKDLTRRSLSPLQMFRNLDSTVQPRLILNL